jgi:adenylate cyclase
VDALELQRLGIYDPSAPDAEDRLRLLQALGESGAERDALVRAAATNSLGALALELALRGPGAGVVFDDASREAGLDTESASALWRALGFADPQASLPRLNAAEAEALATLAAASRDLWGPAATIGVARVLGASAARLAEALVEAMRVQFEMPKRNAGVDYSEVVSQYSELAQDQLGSFIAVFDAVFRRHMVDVAAGNWSFDADAVASQRELLVGFVDIEGYTSLSRTLSTRELAELVGQFETVVTDTVARHPAKLIKLIGDAAMIVCEDAREGCRLALEIVGQFGAGVGQPAVRIGLANGPVIALRGDYFGDVVNTASRLAGIAGPSTVVVEESVRRIAADAFAFEQLPPTELKGLGAASLTYRLLEAEYDVPTPAGPEAPQAGSL